MSPLSKDEGLSLNKPIQRAEEIRHPNAWIRYRLATREYAAEFLGVCIMVIFGAGVNCQVVLASNSVVSPSERGSWLSANLGSAVGVAVGVWVSAGHLNPAVTLMFATFREFPWKKVPGYILAQLLGGVTGGALVYANYIHAIDIFEGGRTVRTMATAPIFSTYAAHYMTPFSAFFSEVLATAVLCIAILAINDKQNTRPPVGLAPLVIFFVMLGIGASLGMETGYAINPARDLGPRISTAMVGYGRQVFTFRHHYWIWCPVLGPIVGAQLAAVFYDIFLYTGEDSPFNKPCSLWFKRRRTVIQTDLEAQLPVNVHGQSAKGSSMLPVFDLNLTVLAGSS